MKFLIGIPIVFLFISGLVLLVVATYLYRFWMRITKHIRGEFSDEEIERDTGLSQGNIRIIVMRTKKKLKQQFQNITKTWTH